MTTRPLELIHIDLFRPTKIKSLCDNRFVFVLVDDFSYSQGFSFQNIEMKLSHIFMFLEKYWKRKNFDFTHKE